MVAVNKIPHGSSSEKEKSEYVEKMCNQSALHCVKTCVEYTACPCNHCVILALVQSYAGVLYTAAAMAAAGKPAMFDEIGDIIDALTAKYLNGSEK